MGNTMSGGAWDVLPAARWSLHHSLLVVKHLSARAPGSPATQSLAVGALVGFLAYQLSKKRYRLPPGPAPWPLLGNLLSMRSTEEAFYVTLRRWAKERYGPVISVYMGPTLCVILNDAEVATEALVKRGDDFASRPSLHSLEVLSEGFKSVAFTPLSPSWKLHRRIAMRALRHYMTGEYLEQAVHREVTDVAAKMIAEPGPFDPHPYNSTLMFHVIDAVCFGDVKPADDPGVPKLMEIFERMVSDFGNGFLEDMLPLLRHWPTKKYTRIVGLFFEMLGIINNNIEEHRRTFNPDNIRDLTDSILLSQSEAAVSESVEVMAMWTDTHVGQTISDMFAAGVDTTRLTLDWAMLFLAGHPEVQSRAQREIDEASGARLPAARDRGRLQYTQAVVLETLRLGTIAPITLPHVTTRDTTVAGFDVPKDTMVLVNQWAMLHDPDTWDQPEQFNPERFLDQQGQLKKMDCWTPFSAGRRACLGETVAKPELLLIISCLLKIFTLSLPEGVVYDPQYNVSAGMATHKAKPYKVVVTAR